MKTLKTTFLQAMLLPFVIVCLWSCKKEGAGDLQAEGPGLSGLRNPDPGFVENNMVMYWNEKASLVMGRPGTPPSQCRNFAMIQIAVHDALNSIKPKYERFAM